LQIRLRGGSRGNGRRQGTSRRPRCGACEEAATEPLGASWGASPVCARLDLDRLRAVGIGDRDRFAGRSNGAHLGPVPSERSSGERSRQEAITKTGSSHAHRPIVERPGTTAGRRGPSGRSHVVVRVSRPWRVSRRWRPNGAPTTAASMNGASALRWPLRRSSSASL